MKTKLFTLACLAAFLCFPCIANAQRKAGKALPLKQLFQYEDELASTGCQIKNYPIPDYVYPAVYGTSEGGYVSGTNGYGDKQKANYFELKDIKYRYLLGAKFFFGIANSNQPGNLQKQLYVRVFEAGNDGSPGNELYAESIRFSRIAKLTVDARFVNVIFDSAVHIPASGKFFVSIDFSNLQWSPPTIDSLALVTTTDGDVIPGQGWEQWSDDNWYSMYDAWGGLNFVLGIFPLVSESAAGCSSEISHSFEENSADNINIAKQAPVFKSAKFPNPFSEALTLQLSLNSTQRVSAAVYDLQGRLSALEKPVLFNAALNSITLNSTANLKSGTYILKLHIGTEERSFKIVKQ